MARYAVVNLDRLFEQVNRPHGTYSDGPAKELVDICVQRTLQALYYHCLQEDPRLGAMLALWDEKGDET